MAVHIQHAKPWGYSMHDSSCEPSHDLALQEGEMAEYLSDPMLGEQDDLDEDTAVSAQTETMHDNAEDSESGEERQSGQEDELSEEDNNEVEGPLSQGTAEALASPSKAVMPDSYVEALQNPASADPEVLEEALAWAPEVQTPSELMKQAKAIKETKTRGLRLDIMTQPVPPNY